MLSLPLRDDEDTLRGACLLTGTTEFRTRHAISFLRAAAPPLASALGLHLRAEGNRIGRFCNTIAAALRQNNRTTIVVTLVVILSLLCLLPMRYQVKCDCELQPVVRRFVAAPFEGRLDTSLVEPGDTVKAGDVLARIDGREIKWELSGRLAEFHRVEKERAGYLVSHETAQVEIATFDMQRLELQIEQLEDQTANLDIRSPIDGMVVVGDLSKSEGVPLEKGQTLFEIAPLEKMIIEVAVPEDDVRFVKQGMKTHVSLDAYPMQPRVGDIQRIHPRAELKEHQNIFVAELNLFSAT